MRTTTVEEIPADLVDKAAAARAEMIEILADHDDEIAELYLDGAELTPEILKPAIRRATLAAKLNPVLCGTAFKNKGVQPLLDAVIDYLPSPIDVGAITGLDPRDESSHRHPRARPRTSRSPHSRSRSRPTRTSAS